jgi:hypothetical protein
MHRPCRTRRSLGSTLERPLHGRAKLAEEGEAPAEPHIEPRHPNTTYFNRAAITAKHLIYLSRWKHAAQRELRPTLLVPSRTQTTFL